MSVSIPTDEPGDDPSVRLCINWQWTPFVLGLLHPGTKPDHWLTAINPTTTPEDRETLSVGIERMIAEIVQPSGDCLPPEPCGDAGVVFTDETDFTDTMGDWTIEYGQRTSNGLECRNPSGSLWRAKAWLTLPSTMCIQEIGMELNWHAENNISPSFPNGNLAQLYGEISTHPDLPQFFLNHQYSNDNLNGELSIVVLGIARPRASTVMVYLEGGDDSGEALAWIKNVWVYGALPE